jgi:stearoyl-CoA desaturase (Delta-9 desaturase)
MEPRQLKWTNLLFIAGAHLLAAFAIVYLVVFHCDWRTITLGLAWGAFCGLSITGGYHRLFSHSAYTAAWPLRVFYLVFGAASFQNSALAWSDDHRVHHAHTDHESDPYSISRGFWWAHIGWILFKRDWATRQSRVRDLQADPLLRLQHRFYLPLAILFGVVAPAAIGLAWGDPIGALLVAGWLRLVVQWHATFSVNSFAHLIGTQPFGRTGSARDSWVVALLTMGEGYHNFHHRFQVDYRNGIRWYQFDPTKWWVYCAARIGLAHGLRRAPADRVEAARRETRLGAQAQG